MCKSDGVYAYKIHQGYSIQKWNLYFRELTHGHTGSPEPLLENNE